MAKFSKAKLKKNPWIAAVLNFILPGIGYLYLGQRKIFGALVFISVVLQIVAYRNTTSDSIFASIAGLVILFAFAYDAYKLAEGN
jgi:hypothetical protein